MPRATCSERLLKAGRTATARCSNWSTTAPMLLRRCLVGMGLQPGDQFAQVLRWHRFSRNKDNRSCGERRDWFKIFQHIVGKCVERAVVYKRAVKAETNR